LAFVPVPTDTNDDSYYSLYTMHLSDQNLRVEVVNAFQEKLILEAIEVRGVSNTVIQSVQVNNHNFVTFKFSASVSQ